MALALKNWTLKDWAQKDRIRKAGKILSPAAPAWSRHKSELCLRQAALRQDVRGAQKQKGGLSPPFCHLCGGDVQRLRSGLTSKSSPGGTRCRARRAPITSPRLPLSRMMLGPHKQRWGAPYARL